MNQFETTLQAMAETVRRSQHLVTLHGVVLQLANRIGLPINDMARHVLRHLQQEGGSVELYLLGTGGAPVVVRRGGGSRATLREEAMRAALQRGSPLAGMAARRLTELPGERGLLLEALLEWWGGAQVHARLRGVAEVAMLVKDAMTQLGYEEPIAAVVPAAAADAALPVAPPAGLCVERDQLREGMPRFDASCIALARERDRLEGTHKPMEQLIARYGYTGGHLRRCVRRGRELLGPATVDAPRSAFDLGSTGAKGRRIA